MRLFTGIIAGSMIAATSLFGQSDNQIVDTSAFIPVSGILPAVLKPQSRPYCAVGDILVGPGSTVTIEPGTAILFSPFVGLHIQGVLHAEGTPEQPVVFTSVNDSVVNPGAQESAAPFDWNGIDIYENAVGTTFTSCRISYSVYGIRSQTDQFRILNSLFTFNGNNNVSINGQQQAVDTMPFSYRKPIEQKPEVQSVPAPVVKKKTFRPLRITTLALGCAGLAVGAWGTSRFVDSRRHLEEVANPTPENLKKYTAEDFEKAKKQRNTDAAIMIGGFSAGVLCAVIFTWSFRF